jgi:effector-binding domain-containing protein
VKVQTLPAVDTMAYTVHNGPFATIDEAYKAVVKWINDNGYRIVGPSRELNLKPAKGGSQHDSKTVTEIQYPVDKI